MSQEGPKVTIQKSCTGCKYLSVESKLYFSPEEHEWCDNYYCNHSSKEVQSLSSLKTPEWCPFFNKAEDDQKTLKEKLQELLESNQCGDNSCMFGSPRGMGTNGGCRLDHADRHEIRRAMRKLAVDLKNLVQK